MNREMRRKERKMQEEQILEAIKSSDHGILSVVTEAGYPYGVPVNYGFEDGKFYIHHTADKSLLSECLQNCCKVCFTVVSRHVVDAEKLTAYYDSVIVFGNARIMTDHEEKIDAMMKLMHFLVPGIDIPCKTDADYNMIEIDPVQMTGKHTQ